MRHDLEAHAAGVKAYLELMDRDEEDCTCEDCVVREILEAAYPHLRTLVIEEQLESSPRAIDLGAVDPTLIAPHRLAGS